MTSDAIKRNPLPERNEMLESLYNHATEGIIISDDNGLIADINPAVERMFGYLKQELMGKSIEALVPDRYHNIHNQHRRNFYQNPRSRAMGVGMQLFARKKDGSELPVEISLSTFRTPGGLFVVSFIIDISRRKEQEDALRLAHQRLKQYTKELAASNRELEEFAYVASHDLQEPLRKIITFGDRLKKAESEKLSPDGSDYLQRMLNSALRMQNLISDLLEFSRVTTRSRPFVNIDLHVILREVLADLEVMIEKTNAEITIHELPALDADPTQMRQLFQNLIANAIKFRKAGTEPQVNIFTDRFREASKEFHNDGVVTITVEDNGIGFDEKYAEKIFNIFQRLEGDKYEGTGVGLAVCKKIVTRHNGQITVKSTPGKGSRFTITLPLKQSQNTTAT